MYFLIHLPVDAKYIKLLRSIVEVLKKSDVSMANFQILVQGLKNPVFSIDTDLKFEFVNASFCSFTGYAETELIGSPIHKIIHEEKNTSLFSLLQEG